MLRFIFVCMGVVALSALSIATQVMTDGISDAQMQIAERNTKTDDVVVAIAPPADEPEFNESQLNAIETAAGAETDAGFGAAFTDTAPKALADDEVSPDLSAIAPFAE